jgi:type II secretory pathway pseudopilin PulG
MKLRIANSRFQIGHTGRRPALLVIGNLPRRGASTAGRQSASCRDEARARRVVNPTAFSLVEILVVVALISAIILGLLSMFNQTQRAFRAGMTQVDVLGAGRVATDMIVRELEQITPSYQPIILPPTLNFFSQVPYQAGVYNTPILQPLPGTGNRRMNLIEDVFFLTKLNQQWTGIGYFVRFNQSTNLMLSPFGAGSLYRFESSTPALNGRPLSQLFTEFNTARNKGNDGGSTKLIDGVVHFTVRAYTTNGYWITNNTGMSIAAGYANYSAQTLRGEVETYAFYSNAVPAAVELEIGILEDRAWDRFRSIPNPTAQGNYLVSNTVGSLHLFRQRVPIRNVDPAAYQ